MFRPVYESVHINTAGYPDTPSTSSGHKRQRSEDTDETISSPQPKRTRDMDSDDSDSESVDEPSSFDPNSYYDTAPEDTTAKCVSDFIDVAFNKCLPRKTRRNIAEEFPRPASAKVPTTDPILVDFMARDFPKKQDEQLSKIQASVIASCSPIANLWSELDAQQMKGTKSELIPGDVVMKAIQATLTLVGNASSYISTLRRDNIIQALPKSRENLAKILKQVTKQDVVGEGSHLFGEQAMDEVSKRITTLESFRKSANKADPNKQKQQNNRFLGKGPTAKYGGRPGRTYSHLYDRSQKQGKIFQRQGNGPKGSGRPQKYYQKPGSNSKQ